MQRPGHTAHSPIRRFSGPVLAVLLAAAFGCAQEEYPLALYELQHPGAGSSPLASPDASTGTAPSGPATCLQARAQSYPQRLVAMSTQVQSQATGNVVLGSDLFQMFNETCNPCHTAAADPPGQGGFQIVEEVDFSTRMTQAVIDHVTHAVCPQDPEPLSPYDPMPPCSSPDGETFSTRATTEPIWQFATLVQEWINAGQPTAFTPPPMASGAGDGGAPATDAGSVDGGSVSSFVLSAHNGNAMTNIGTCVPGTGLIGIETEKSAQLDAMFAAAKVSSTGTAVQRIGLPEHLGDTDLFTLDSAVLAQYGVIGYAPAYPLWTDNAGKLRYVRVPRGQSIHFDKATQKFSIPPNTRFYKTFMKEISDTDGSYRWRKIETRLIVSRPDQTAADGTVTQSALFGTYQWNADESDAVLVQTPLNDGQPFSDTLFYYNTDEQLAADVLSAQPTDPEEALLEQGAIRHYAIPGSPRCIQCHMGSESESFVLGFMPLQINRRPQGTGGVIEPAGPDELTQLQRFIDAGLITGIDSPSDILLLEQSEGSRTPRNGYELVAQGYVLGNCAHCHNPRGLPTVQNPVLAGVLDFLPTAAGGSPIGGLFQFPLERYSPRIGRGLTGTTPIPYVTPSLVDLPKLDPNSGSQEGDWFVYGSGTAVYLIDYAPWRSLIYRNVDNPFAYTDDFALYPHMPMNSPGYDPRAKQILGSWMVSIPAVRKHPEIPEYAYQTDGTVTDDFGGSVVDWTPQPYAEVPPGDPDYDAAVAAAKQRLSVFQTGVNPAVTLAPGGTTYSRYLDPGETSDILDPDVIADPVCHPIPVGVTGLAATNPLPEHPHWVNTDLTQAPGPWAPRQPNWGSVLVEQQIPAPSLACGSAAGQQLAYQDMVTAVGLLPNATLDQVSDYATTAVPFGLWQVEPGCDFSSTSTAGSFTGAARPHWMDVVDVDANAPVYSETPGAAIFKMICINCHGPNADSNGRLAQNLATMTGGNALVADFRDGLFGPVGAPADNDNRSVVFGDAALQAIVKTGGVPVGPNWTGVTVDDRAARYMAWMGLGGTSVNIPVAVLQLVAITKVLNQERLLEGASLSANMLSQTKALCLGLLGPTYSDALAGAGFDARPGHGYLDAKITHLNHSLIPENGDAEMWLHLCSMANPAPIHVLTIDFVPPPNGRVLLDVPTIQDSNYDLRIAGGSLVANSTYPAGVAIGNSSGGVDPSLDASNEWPWCVDDNLAAPNLKPAIEQSGLPMCPAAVSSTAETGCEQSNSPNCFGNDQANAWAVRGAINAGFSVFTYVRSIENTGPLPDYNQCNLLP